MGRWVLRLQIRLGRKGLSSDIHCSGFFKPLFPGTSRAFGALSQALLHAAWLKFKPLRQTLSSGPSSRISSARHRTISTGRSTASSSVSAPFSALFLRFG